MLLRVRVSLPDRPGSLGQVARTLGVSGADVVQVVVLERLGGRAVDDFTVVWPAAARVDGLLAGLSAVPGVHVLGLWQAIGAPVTGGCDAELLGHIAVNPADGVATLVDALPGLLAADWAATVVVPADWASGLAGTPPQIVCASWQTPELVTLPDIAPLRPRAFRGAGGTRYAAVPFGRAGLVLLVARTVDSTVDYGAPDFHTSEVDRIAQLVRTAALLLADRLDPVGTP